VLPGSDPEAASKARGAAAARYRPDKIALLLVAEAPPADLERYFYFEDVREHDALFRYVTKGILGHEVARSEKAQALSDLRDRGVFLVDLHSDPVTRRSRTAEESAVLDLLDRVRQLAPERVILIKANVYDAAYQTLREGGVPVVDERIPFPSSGQQRRFDDGFARALTAPPPLPYPQLVGYYGDGELYVEKNELTAELTAAQQIADTLPDDGIGWQFYEMRWIEPGGGGDFRDSGPGSPDGREFWFFVWAGGPSEPEACDVDLKQLAKLARRAGRIASGST
jgi:hypothetical protein